MTTMAEPESETECSDEQLDEAWYSAIGACVTLGAVITCLVTLSFYHPTPRAPPSLPSVVCIPGEQQVRFYKPPCTGMDILLSNTTITDRPLVCVRHELPATYYHSP